MSDTPITPLESRRQEVAQYDANIVMYQTIIDTLPSDWPDRLAGFKGRKDHQHAVTEAQPEDVELLAQLLFREQCHASLLAEKLERTKAASILAVLEAQAK